MIFEAYLYLLFNKRAAVAESKDCRLSQRTKSNGRRGAKVLNADLNTKA